MSTAVATTPAGTTRGVPAVRRCVLDLVEIAPCAAPRPDALAGRVIAVIGGDPDRRASIERIVVAHGAQTIPFGDTDPARLRALDAIIDLNLTHTDRVAPGVWTGPLDASYDLLADVAPRWSRESRPGSTAYVAVTAFGGRLGADPNTLRQPLSGLWAGLAKTLPREFPACDVRVLDIADDVDPGYAVVAELVSGRFTEVGWEDGRRSVLVPRPAPVPVDGEALDAESVVLLTGGGRGIGYHLARRLRAEVGCRVIVTGRQDLAQLPDDLMQATAERFTAWTQGRLRQTRGATALRATRAEIDRLTRARELTRNLEAARRAGAELEYVPCDVTNPAQVAGLIAGIDATLAAVVHDAGIDRPARIANVSRADLHTVVSVKVDGFLSLLDALDGRSAGRICAVGSLTGRYGGTAGQTGYAAGNEALARVAGWAGRDRPEPVTSLSWPTWHSVGLITDPRAAVREMSALPVDAGISIWIEELTGGARGEVCFLAPLGALSPAEMRGIPVPSDAAEASRLVGRRRMLGDVEDFAPGTRLITRHPVDLTARAARGFRVDGRPALPATVLLELALDAARWLVPNPLVAATPVEVRDVAIPLRLLRSAELRRTATTIPVGDEWHTSVTFVDSAAPAAESVAFAAAEYPTAVAAAVVVSRASGRGHTITARAAVGHLALPDSESRAVQWHAVLAAIGAQPPASARRALWGEPRSGRDVFGGAHAPDLQLPDGVLEAALWTTCPNGTSGAAVLRIDRLVLGDGDASSCSAGFLDPDGTVTAADDTGAVVASVQGITWEEP